MIIKRLYSSESAKRFKFTEFLRQNSSAILALIPMGTFGLGLYVNQMRVYEEKLNNIKSVFKEKLDKAKSVFDEKLDKAKAVFEEKLKTAEERADKEALNLLYNVFTQEEYQDAKRKLLAQKDK